jgi:aspartate/methionine/tyrosine aminotransferase
MVLPYTEFDLTQGEPYFLSKILQDHLQIIEPICDLSYPPVQGDELLVHELHLLLPQFKFIVPTNGATQGLLAAFSYFKNVEKCDAIQYDIPYWYHFDNLIKYVGLSNYSQYTRFLTGKEGFNLITSPNNPDGIVSSETECSIQDASYYNPFYPIYGSAPLLNSRITLFSSSKMLGTAGFRIGWVGTNEQEINDYIIKYEAETTAGCSILSQRQVAGILHHFRRHDMKAYFKKAKEVLEENRAFFNLHLSKYLIENNNSGMFAWFKVKDPVAFAEALKSTKVMILDGRLFGMTEDGWYRMSLGASQDMFFKAIETLSGELAC